MYYKIILNSQIIGVSTSDDCLRFQSKHSMLLRASDNAAEYIECNGLLYHAYWMQPIKTDKYQYEIADILTIGEQEYNILAPEVENEPIPYEEPEEEEEIIINPTDPVDEITLEYVRTNKINQMSRICRTTIESGIDLEIRGETKHFSLTTQDQLNLMSAQTMAQTQTLIPYHADGEETDFYTNEEINQIAEAAAAFKVQHTTYYNSLKTYINTLETIEEISAITYGVEIPDEYKSDVLKVLEQ